MKRRLSIAVILLGMFALVPACRTMAPEPVPVVSQLQLAGLFTDGMVLQRDVRIPVWGCSAPGSRVVVSIDAQVRTADANEHGRWAVNLDPLGAGGPYEMTVASDRTITLADVLVGDVWVCSGQSNMQMPVQVGKYGVANADAEVANANYPRIRLFTVWPAASHSRQDRLSEEKGPSFVAPDDNNRWVECSPDTVGPFSAAGYFFGRHLHEQLDVPIGLINASWGGTIAEAWTSEPALRRLPELRPVLDEMYEALPELDAVEREYERELAEWNKNHQTWRADFEASDRGYDGDRAVWAEPEFAAADWATMELPQLWETAGLTRFDGYLWYRKTFDLAADRAGEDLTLHLGPINDMDWTWLNGQLVGSTTEEGNAETPRVYPVPAGVARAGRNVLVVRVYDMGNVGGLWGKPEDLRLECAGAEPLSLAGTWQYKEGADLAMIPPKPSPPKYGLQNPNQPSVLFNAMIAPMIPYAIRGAIWYQGESNTPRPYEYRNLFPAMIQDWRDEWGQGDFPFLFVQLANWLRVASDKPFHHGWPELRESQAMTLSLPNTGMAVTIDIGEADDIHPKNKQDVGKRLALAARHVAYGENLVYSGPIYRSMQAEGRRIRVFFEHVGGGLVANGGDLTGFEVAGRDQVFVPAQARIDGEAVAVWSPAVAEPVAVRYGWAINPPVNLHNREGLPASPFRTDDWREVTETMAE
jgi:sialate O-acetylesterase